VLWNYRSEQRLRQYSTTLNGKPAINTSGLTPDEEFQAGLACDGVKATQTSGFGICDAAQSDLQPGEDSLRPAPRTTTEPAAHPAAQPVRYGGGRRQRSFTSTMTATSSERG
jgi:hypothetical protein